MGVLTEFSTRRLQMYGQLVYVNGEKVAQLEFATPADVPFGFIAIPQYETERILREELAMHGVHVERGVRVTGFEQDADGVTATLAGDRGQQTVRAGYLIGADGAHSAVRKALGLTFEGARVRGAVHARRRRGGLVAAAGLRRSGRCTRPTARPTTCWSAFRCRAAAATGCRCWFPTS